MKIQIKHRYTGAVLHEGDYISMMDAVAGAIKCGSDLRGSDLRGSDLRGSDLRGSDLRGSDLRGSDLSGSDLSCSDLSGSNLRGSNLRGSDLSGSDLSGSDLSCSDLRGSNLSCSNLSCSNLSGSNLSGSNLSGSNLSCSNLSGSNLSGSNLSGSKNSDLVIARTRILPDGDLVGWKKLQGGLIAKLLIPSKAKRSHAFGRKCRASCAKVVTIYDGKKQVKEGVSRHDDDFKYRVGRIVKPKLPFSERWMEECDSGIHFYITRIEAENH